VTEIRVGIPNPPAFRFRPKAVTQGDTYYKGDAVMSQKRSREGDTRRKLEETEFFLGQLKPNYRKVKKFDNYLSAYFSAARSVMWVMRAEYDEVPEWEAWFKKRMGELDSDEKRLFAGTTKLRNRSQKSEPVKTLKETFVSDLYLENGDTVELQNVLKRIAGRKILTDLGGVPGKYTVEFTIDGQRVKLLARSVQMDRRLEEFPNEHILTVCQSYYALLAAIVKECEARFG
jgi:hypothetical protein